MAMSSGILQSFLRDAFKANKKLDDLRFEDLLDYSRTHSEHRSNDFLTPLSFYLGILGDTDKVKFIYMNQDQKDQLSFELKITLLLLLAQQKHEIDYQKTENFQIYEAQIKRCKDLLKALDPEYQKLIAKAPEQEELTDEKPIKYLGISLGQEFGKQIIGLMDLKTKDIKAFMGALNEKRLYWVWGSVFLKTVISLVPEDFFYSTQASDAIKTPDPYTGCLSWTLYYFRFSINLFLLLKHTVNGSWMSEEEAKTPWYERFQTQWSQRKFTLLNDSLWGTANLVCFFWLNGKGILGTWGDALTVALLIFDISVAIWDFEEQKTEYNQQMMQYDKDIEKLKETLILNEQIEDEKERAAKNRQIQMQINTLQRARSKCERDWQFQKLSLINNIAYAVGLMLAFVVLAMPFLPVSAPVAATLAIVGAVLCLAFTIINNAIKGGIELYKTQQTIKDIKANYNDKVKLLREELLLPEDESKLMLRKLLFLDIKKLKAETEYQNQMIVYQSVNLVRSIMLEVLVPAIVFSSLVFLPLGIGVAALGAALGLAIASHYLIDNLFKPEEKKELEFDQQEYEQFCDSLHKTEKDSSHSFFKNVSKDKSSAKGDKEIDVSRDSSLDSSGEKPYPV